jgi:hypothetical protein
MLGSGITIIQVHISHMRIIEREPSMPLEHNQPSEKPRRFITKMLLLVGFVIATLGQPNDKPTNQHINIDINAAAPDECCA